MWDGSGLVRIERLGILAESSKFWNLKVEVTDMTESCAFATLFIAAQAVWKHTWSALPTAPRRGNVGRSITETTCWLFQ